MSHVGLPAWWCNEIVDVLEMQCVSDEDFDGDGIERAKFHDVLDVSHSTHRRHFGFSAQSAELLLEVRALAMPPRHFLLKARVLDISGFWVTCHDFRLHVVAATATLFMMVNCRPLLTEPHRSLSVQRTTTKWSRRLCFVEHSRNVHLHLSELSRICIGFLGRGVQR